MAVIGYEADQVFKTEEGDVSVPITWAYNHHYVAYLIGANSEMRKVPADIAHRMGHATGQDVWHSFLREDINDPNPGSSIPASQWFSEGNGGEFRKSFHGYPQGMAQLIDSPTAFHIEPMQIDTRNRHYNGTDFKADILPSCSAAPPNASYSGLLECPCASRIDKNISISYVTATHDMCKTEIHNSKECLEAASNLGIKDISSSIEISDEKYPSGCFSTTLANGSMALYYNTISSSVECGGGDLKSGKFSADTSKVNIQLDLDSSSSTATITMSGPDGKWFAAGFNAPNFAMSDLPYTIVVDGAGNVAEYKLANHAPGSQIKTSVKIKSNKAADGVRTVVLERDMTGATSDHFNFDFKLESIDMIFASGSESTYSYHGTTRSGGTLHMMSVESPTCICYEGVSGSINNIPFSKSCLPPPKGDLLKDRNPTCWVDTYQGGLHCCHHEVVLLDKDQEQPEEEMTYHMKFRFWFQEYKEENGIQSHQNLIRFFWVTEAMSGEYDIPKCDEQTADENCVYEITSNFTVRDMMQDCDVRKNPSCWGNTTDFDGINIIYAAGHCHAPSCLIMELYNADTNELLCRHDPVYGKSHEVFDELGFIAIPPCLFGPEDQGLTPPTFLSYDTNLFSRKVNNNTNAHYGEMALWQMRGVLAKK
eukprot:TRINITY_DN7775_c0_g3_i4.p1 TRINITY_DN7775_c0_g3~~TRINITY_DN7775_c0_g3_i4.p1  ORF type:complete len:732 (-),score=82.04 TRINITY_DN7775_c0_g3_i4:96-2048(-)